MVGFYAIYDEENQGVKLVDDEEYNKVKSKVTSGKPNIDSINYEACRDRMRFKPIVIRRFQHSPIKPSDLLAVYDSTNQSVIAVTRADYEKNKVKYEANSPSFSAPTIKPVIQEPTPTTQTIADTPKLAAQVTPKPIEKISPIDKKGLEALNVIKKMMNRRKDNPMLQILQQEIADLKCHCQKLGEANKPIFLQLDLQQVEETKIPLIERSVKVEEIQEIEALQQERDALVNELADVIEEMPQQNGNDHGIAMNVLNILLGNMEQEVPPENANESNELELVCVDRVENSELLGTDLEPISVPGRVTQLEMAFQKGCSSFNKEPVSLEDTELKEYVGSYRKDESKDMQSGPTEGFENIVEFNHQKSDELTSSVREYASQQNPNSASFSQNDFSIIAVSELETLGTVVSEPEDLNEQDLAEQDHEEIKLDCRQL